MKTYQKAVGVQERTALSEMLQMALHAYKYLCALDW